MSPDSIVTMGSDGSSQAVFQTTCVPTPVWATTARAWSPDGHRLVFERAFGPIVKDTAAGLDLVTASADGTNEQLILHFRSLEARERSRMTRSGRRMARGSR